MKVHLHIDNRLIHGQVTVTWCSFFGVNLIIVADDKVAADPLQKAMLPQAARGIKTEVLSVSDAANYLKQKENEASSVLVIAKTPLDALELLKKGIKAETINVGNQAPVAGTKYVMILNWIAVTAEDAKIYKEIGDFGYKITTKRTPNDREFELVDLLKKKGLL
ncbi:PTS system mannose/fructose/N-acetylgalactosamine-transporter subunit IIB [Caldisericum sp.]|jgi:PTS system mannose-specific IIB component|uniref:PTS system mannose/fructose/N-acetylgalactosamine-transporter subunit IIB n=1 Tax=Caldisericum sp. TaxID=2499687 RepID=UPI003C8C57D0